MATSKRKQAQEIQEGDVIRVAHLEGEWAVVDVLSTQMFVESCESEAEAFVFFTDSWSKV